MHFAIALVCFEKPKYKYISFRSQVLTRLERITAVQYLVVNVLYSDIAGGGKTGFRESFFVTDTVNTVRKQQKQKSFLKKYFMG